MVVFCPGCGAKISAQPTPDSPGVQCPRCQSTFNVEGVKATATAAPPPPRVRKKKASGGKAVGVLILVLVLLSLGGGTAGVLYLTGVIGSHSSPGPAVKAPASSSSPPTAATGWKEFENSEAKFSARFPGDPKRTQRSARGRVRDVAYELEVNGVAYGVVYADLDKAGLMTTTPEQYIEQQHQALASGGKLQSEKSVTLGSYKGKEFVFDVPNQGTAYMRFYAAGRRLYSVLVVGKSRSPAPSDVAALFDSFRILD